MKEEEGIFLIRPRGRKVKFRIHLVKSPGGNNAINEYFFEFLRGSTIGTKRASCYVLSSRLRLVSLALKLYKSG